MNNLPGSAPIMGRLGSNPNAGMSDQQLYEQKMIQNV